MQVQLSSVQNEKSFSNVVVLKLGPQALVCLFSSYQKLEDE